MAALLSTVDTEPLSDPPHSQHSIVPAPQADVGTSSGSILLPLPEDFVLPYTSSAPSPDPHTDDFIDPLLRSVFNPADGTSSVHIRVGTHPSITEALHFPTEALSLPYPHTREDATEPHNVCSALTLPSSSSPNPSSPVAAIPGGAPIDNLVLSFVHSPIAPHPSFNQCSAATSYSTTPLAALPDGASTATQISSVAPLPIALSSTSTGTRSPGAASNTVTGPRKRSMKATAPLTEVTASESGRGQRLRKAPATKEVVPLTDISRKTPEWLRLAYEFFTDKAAGPAWDRCVAAWFAFEGTASPDEITSVSSIVAKYIPPMLIQPSQSRIPESKHRPKVLSQWLLTRRYSHPPEISDAAAFGLEWLTWWNALQPAWRKSRAQGTLPVPLDPKRPSSHNVRSLHKRGPNGLLTVLIGLKCWQLAGGDSDLWTRAVDDVTSCCEDAGMVSTPAKRLASSDSR
jgi:hypothetical protein